MKEKAVLKKSAYYLVIIICLTILLSYGITYFINGRSVERANVFGYKLVYVATGSMEPTIKTGSIILCKMVSANEIDIGDICNYKISTENSGKTIIHRIIAQKENGTYIFKGDNNPEEDTNPVSPSNIYSKYIATIYRP